MSFYIGIDGGGTKTAYALFDENKNMLSMVKTKGSNHENLEGSFDEATDIIMEGVNNLLKENNLTDDDRVTGIEPIIERSTTTDSASVSDLSIVLEEGNELYTYISFEIDEQGVPYWIASVYDYKVGVFGGKDIVGAVLVNACTGEHKYYDID